MRFFPENIPAELKDPTQWSLWRRETRDDKPAKVPYQPDGKRAKSNDASTWNTFRTVLSTFQDIGGFDGICWMMPVKPSDLIFIDIDHCIKDGIIEQWAQEVIDEFDSYTERSQSGNGLHILIKGQKPIKRCRKHGSPYEIYDCLRPCYLTGDVADSHSTIEARQDPLNKLFNEIFSEEIERANEPQQKARPGKSSLSDEALILKATLAKNGREFKDLYDGVTLGYGSDDSAADMALMNKLAFWTGGDALQMERIFSSSGLGRRAKWRDRVDYRERTINKAIFDAREFYSPNGNGGQSNAAKAKELSEADLLNIKIPENPRFNTLLEPDNFIQEFIRYGETVTDSYQDYWFAGGLSCLSIAVNRNIVIKLRQGPIYPNVWINILGLSSLARKSTAIDKTDLTIAAANIDPSCKMPDEFSPEAMIEMLDRQPRAYMIKDESAGLLAVMKKDYMRGLKDALMQLYDGKDINRELRTSRRKSDKTSFQVKNPYLNLMLATTPGSFAANTELLDVTSGWLPRFLHFFPNHAKDRWLPLEEGVPENDLLSAGCHARLIKTRSEFYDLAEPRMMHLSREASAHFVAWQKDRESELVEAKDDRRAQFYSRLAVYALKMSMLFTVGRADYADGMEISLNHMQEACRLVDDYFMQMSLTVADLVGKAADKNLMDKIISVLTSRGGKLKRRELIRAVHAKKKDLDESLEALEESREIQLVTVSNRQGSPTQWITLSSDNENRAKCHSVTSVKADILSHHKENPKDVGKEDLVRQYDTCDTMPPCDRKPVDNDSSNATVSESVGEGDKPSSGPHPRKDEPTPTRKKPAKEDPGFQKFKAGMAKRHCCLCGRSFPYDLTPYYTNGKSGYICATCHMQGPPTAPQEPEKADSQTKLEAGA